MSEKKQIPFRYPEELEEDFKELFRWQGYTNKKNEALIDSIQICAKLSRVLEKFKEEGYGYCSTRTLIYNLIKKLEEISKKPGKKDIKKLDLIK